MPKFYFDSPQKKLGDAAKDEENYEQALFYYQQAFTHLNQIIARPNFVESLYSYNGLAGALSDIIFCSAHLSLNSLEQWSYQKIADFRQEIMAHLERMHSVDEALTKIVLNDLHARRRRAKIYGVLASVAEALSDRLVDIFEQDPAEDNLLMALSWLEKALEYRKAIELPIKMQLHLGYLNLLERAFRIEKDQDFLVQMKDYIRLNALENNIRPGSSNHLELLNYQLLIAIEQKSSNETAHFIRQYRILIKALPRLIQNRQVINDIGELIQKSIQLKAQPQNLNKKSSRRVIEEDEEELILLEQERAKRPKLQEANNEQLGQPMHILQAPISNSFFAQKDRAPKPGTTPSSQIFASAMKRVAQNYSEPEFLATLLSFVAHFYYYKKCPYEMNITKAHLIAYSMYSDALMIDPHCAHAYREYGAITESLHLHSPERRFSMSDLECFNQAIDNHITEVETFIGERESEEIFCELFLHIVNYTSKKIDKTKADQVASLMFEADHNDNSSMHM
ncbi:hypothetical protein J2N86_10615 [Legionella lytica]|uniref:Uncharacterized protein n=1 Tax=Legionella lytica TaxID=96232 RepID=A0ABY4Y7R0_9GAMM|nr:hypothetical protein [Legionella lytica]USQ13139.1 hypothetical protein J2N86_10615 [Legionella lytica]